MDKHPSLKHTGKRFRVGVTFDSIKKELVKEHKEKMKALLAKKEKELVEEVEHVAELYSAYPLLMERYGAYVEHERCDYTGLEMRLYFLLEDGSSCPLNLYQTEYGHGRGLTLRVIERALADPGSIPLMLAKGTELREPNPRILTEMARQSLAILLRGECPVVHPHEADHTCFLNE